MSLCLRQLSCSNTVALRLVRELDDATSTNLAIHGCGFVNRNPSSETTLHFERELFRSVRNVGWRKHELGSALNLNRGEHTLAYNGQASRRRSG